ECEVPVASICGTSRHSDLEERRFAFVRAFKDAGTALLARIRLAGKDGLVALCPPAVGPLAPPIGTRSGRARDDAGLTDIAGVSRGHDSFGGPTPSDEDEGYADDHQDSSEH